MKLLANSVVITCSGVSFTGLSRNRNQSKARTRRLRGLGAKGSDWTTRQMPPMGLLVSRHESYCVQRVKMKSSSRPSCKHSSARPNCGLTNTCGRRGRGRYLVGEELEVDGPLVGEDATELVGAREVSGGVGGEEGKSGEELDDHNDSEEEEREGNTD